ncbi:uncharacterized protein KZ484_009156 isoform 2-T3 [Pholidichthys leucotaenia]
MNEQRSSRQMGGMEGGDSSAQMLQRGGGIGGGSNLGSTMKLFASLGLSPSDLDVLAKIPEEEISVETLPRILLQLKNRKRGAEEHRASSSDASYRGGREGWEKGNMGRMGGFPLSQGSARPQSSAGFGYSSVQDISPGRGYDLNFSGGGGGGRDRPYSELSSHSGMGMGPGPSDPVFMQRRIGSPSNGKIQDFMGVLPATYPHVCSLCDFDVHSMMEWNQHISGLRHVENKRKLLNIGGLLDPPNMSAGLLGPAPMSSGPMGGMPSSWGGGPGLQGSQNQLRTRVVFVKYDRKPLSDKTLFAFAKPFGRLNNHLILKNKAFLELSSPDEARNMINYYMQNPAMLYGKRLNFEPSDRHHSIQEMMRRPARDMGGHGSRVVFLSKLPPEDSKKKQLLTMARRFGVVEKHLFLTDRAFIQLGTCEDAEMMVKYYNSNPLVMDGRLIRLNVCEKYKTLDVSRTDSGGGDAQNQKSSRDSSSFKTSSTPKPTSSKSSSSSEKKSGEDKEKSEEKPAVEQEELLQGGDEEEEEEEEDDDEEDEEDDDEEEEMTEEQRAELLKDMEETEEALKEEDQQEAHDVTREVPKDVGGTTVDPTQGAEPEEQTGATEAPTEEPETKDDSNVEAGGDVPEHMGDQDFLENMEDLVTVDELQEDENEGESDNIDHSRRGGLRVVNIIGIRRGYNYLNELLRLAEPFGKVVKHLVLNVRPEAFLQFTTEEEARSMVKFYNSNVMAMVCGQPVRVNLSMNYPTIKFGDNKVVYICNIPGKKYSDAAILRLAEPYGKINQYFMNRMKQECFIEMERAEDARRMVRICKRNGLTFHAKPVKVYMSKKYRQLKYGNPCPNLERPVQQPKSGDPSTKKSKKKSKKKKKKVEQEKRQPVEDEEKKEALSEEEGLPAEEDMVLEDSDEQEKTTEDEQTELMETLTGQNGETEDLPTDAKPSVATLPLPPYDPETPIGAEHVKMGYYCRVCFLCYASEETAKKTHCSSQAHYEKLQKHMETEKTKSEKRKKTSA